MQSPLRSQVTVALAAERAGAPANDNFRLPQCLIRDGWWLAPECEAANASLSFVKIGARHD